MIWVSYDMVSDSGQKYLIDNICEEIYCVFVGFFEHDSGIKVFHVQNVGVNFLMHKPIKEIQLIKLN